MNLLTAGTTPGTLRGGLMSEVEGHVAVEVLGPFLWLPDADDETPCIFSTAAGKSGGVYLMTVSTDSGWLIFGVGQTSRPVRDRFATHSREYMAGTYNVLDAGELRAGRRVERWRGIWWRRESSARYEEYLSRAGEITPHTTALLKAARIFLLPVGTDRRLLNRVEAAIANTLYGDPEVGHIPDKGMKLAPRWNSEAPVRLTLSGAGFRGLPSVLEV